MQEDRLTKQKKSDAYAKAFLDLVYDKDDNTRLLKLWNFLEQINLSSVANVASIKDLDDYKSNHNQSEESSKEIYEIVEKTFKGCDPDYLAILHVIAENSDMHLIQSIFQSFKDQAENKLDAFVVDVVTAIKIDDDLRKLFNEKAQNDLDSKVILVEHVNPNVLGGFIMSCHGRVIDASLKTKVIDLKYNLMKTKVS